MLVTLEKLLSIDSLDVVEVLTQTSDLVARALYADKVDIFLYQPEIEALVAMGVSHTPVGRKQKELGLDVLYLQNNGRTVGVYQDQKSFITGHAEDDPEQLVGVVNGLGIHSIISVPLYVTNQLRGVVEATAIATDAFSEYDLRFLEAVTGWVSIILHRTELIQERLREAREEIWRATAEDLITIIAHDLRNYFTPIGGRLTLLRNRAVEDARTLDLREVESLENSFKHLNRLVNNLLDVTRLEQGSMSIKKELVDVSELVKDVANVFNSPINPVKVEITGMPGDLRVAADPLHLRQALENLVANALNHSPREAEVILKISFNKNPAEKKEQWVTIEVEDCGPGINPDALAHIFERFVKHPGSLGLGLGLYISREIARAHGGTLTVETPLDKGRGTRFFLSLPVS
ncbi:MAG: GAF domain-containing protein [Chloroflexi bacterium]|nr:GAF domain-containing protein [Chloroflexota bacterium]